MTVTHYESWLYEAIRLAGYGYVHFITTDFVQSEFLEIVNVKSIVAEKTG